MILIIDDDIAVRTSLSLLLKNASFDVTTAATPTDALDILQQQDISLVVLDMNFSNSTSGDDGLKMLEIIKQRYPSVSVCS